MQQLLEELNRKRDIEEANSSLVQWRAMRLLASNNTLAATIEIAGLKQGVCLNEKLIPVIDHNIQEIEKFLNNEPNEWE